MPYDETDTMRPAAAPYRRQQTEQVCAHLMRLIGQDRPDLILVGRESFVWGVPDLAVTSGIPSAVMCHGTIFYLLQGRYPEPLGAWLLAELRKTDLIICCARHMAETMTDAGFSRPLALSNAIDATRFRPAAKDRSLLGTLGFAQDALIAVHASNLKPIKRLSDVLDAAVMVRQSCPRLCYLIVGDGRDRSIVENACRDRGLADQFRFVGWIDQMRMPEFFNLADMVIMPSASEGISLACLETMACGRLVIASDIPGAREIITDGETGLLFRMGKIEDLAAKIVLAAGDPGLRTRIGRAARAYVERHHRLEDMVGRYEAVLQGLIARQHLATDLQTTA